MLAHTSCQTDQVEISHDYLDNEESIPPTAMKKYQPTTPKPVSSTLPRPSSSARIPETPIFGIMVLLPTETSSKPWKPMCQNLPWHIRSTNLQFGLGKNEVTLGP
ncbi:unnamed protein product [Absidia cylindrospora]